jgi:hypothetical protein
MDTLQKLYQSILKGRAPEVKTYTEKALAEKILLQKIISEGTNRLNSSEYRPF